MTNKNYHKELLIELREKRGTGSVEEKLDY